MNNKMENCIFCKIVKGELPCIKIYEDEEFIAFEDIQPVNKGHTLIIPKEHSSDILKMNPKMGTVAFKLIQKIGTAMMKGLDAKGFNTIINTKAPAGQTVFHTHINIVPRYENDGLKLFRKKEITEEERIITAEKIIKGLY